MKALDGVPYVVWLTIHEARTYYKSDNDVLRQKATQYPNMRIADWNAVANATPASMGGDGLHLTDDWGCHDGQARRRHDRSHLLRWWRWDPTAPAPAAPADPNATCLAATAPQGAPSPESGHGYWLLDSKGHVFGFGRGEPRRPHQPRHSDAAGLDPVDTDGRGVLDRRPEGPRVHVRGRGEEGRHGRGDPERTGPSPRAGADRPRLLAARRTAASFTFGVPFFGSAGARPPNAAVISMASTATGGGYMMVTAHGEVIAFGDTKSQGDTKALRPRRACHLIGAGHVRTRLLAVRTRRWRVLVRCALPRLGAGAWALQRPEDGHAAAPPIPAAAIGSSPTAGRCSRSVTPSSTVTHRLSAAPRSSTWRSATRRTTQAYIASISSA